MNYIKRYADFLESFVRMSNPVKVVFDCSNGAVAPILEELKRVKNLESLLINEKMDGDFPAHGPNPLTTGATDQLKKTIQDRGADFGVIFDSDGDRSVFLDESGAEINPHHIFLCLKDFFNPPYVVNVNALKDFTMPEVEIVEERVGRFNMIRAMRENRASFGVEHSSHYYFKDFFYSDAGILSAIFLANYVSKIKEENSTLSQSINGLNSLEWPNETNFKIEDDRSVISNIEKHYGEEMGLKMKKLDGISIFGPDFAFNLRTSNTEPLVRLNLVAVDKEVFDKKLLEIKKVMGVK